MLLHRLLELTNLLLQRLDSAVVVGDRSREHFLGLVFFLLPGCKCCFFALLLPFLDQGGLLKVEVLLHLFFGVELVSEQVVILLVRFLDVVGQLFGVLLLQSFNGLVVLFEFLKLLFEFLASGIEALLQVLDFNLHLLNFLLVLAFKGGRLVVDQLSVSFEGLLALLPLCAVFLFKLTDFFFPTGAVLGLCQGVFLLGYHLIRGNKQGLDFFLVGIVVRSQRIVVFFVFGVQVEDDLGELGDLFAHFVVGFLRNLGHHFLVKFKLLTNYIKAETQTQPRYRPTRGAGSCEGALSKSQLV